MLSSLISPSDIKINLESTEKEECFAELLEVAVAKQPQMDRKEALNSLIEREDQMSTAVFPGIAVPHSVCDSVKKSAVVIGVSKKGIEFASLDPKAGPVNVVHIIFELFFEKSEADTHLYILKDIAKLVTDPEFINKVLNLNNSQEIYDIICELDK